MSVRQQSGTLENMPIREDRLNELDNKFVAQCVIAKHLGAKSIVEPAKK
jgi:hypothetical protein